MFPEPEQAQQMKMYVSNFLDKELLLFCICMFHLTIFPVAHTTQHQVMELQVNNKLSGRSHGLI